MKKPLSRPGKGSAADIAGRRKRIADVVMREQFVSVQDLVEDFNVTSVTIRGDIEAIAESSDLFRQVRGGIVRVQPYLTETRFEDRATEYLAMKRSIGKAALGLIQPNDNIFLDVGTTTMEIANALASCEALDGLTVFTNGMNIALALEGAWPRIDVVVTGGTLRPHQHSLVDPLASLILDAVQISKAFIGCNGIDPKGAVSAVNLPESELKAKVMKSSNECILVADASKFGNRALAQFGTLEDFTHCIFAGELSPTFKKSQSGFDIDWIDANIHN